MQSDNAAPRWKFFSLMHSDYIRYNAASHAVILRNFRFIMICEENGYKKTCKWLIKKLASENPVLK